ncbi:zinc finger protein GLIS3 [Caerostris extrusa]|uniref:Zinc finger protein GLIS3 n=1 Tax=Caerostris extrusa TaxID=172846 RepID=A0AAV4N7N1_CAEEX|nr:zinc finger protein GLIS3 [Caerostris extrusa]
MHLERYPSSDGESRTFDSASSSPIYSNMFENSEHDISDWCDVSGSDGLSLTNTLDGQMSSFSYDVNSSQSEELPSDLADIPFGNLLSPAIDIDFNNPPSSPLYYHSEDSDDGSLDSMLSCGDNVDIPCSQQLHVCPSKINLVDNVWKTSMIQCDDESPLNMTCVAKNRNDPTVNQAEDLDKSVQQWFDNCKLSDLKGTDVSELLNYDDKLKEWYYPSLDCGIIDYSSDAIDFASYRNRVFNDCEDIQLNVHQDYISACAEGSVAIDRSRIFIDNQSESLNLNNGGGIKVEKRRN